MVRSTLPKARAVMSALLRTALHGVVRSAVCGGAVTGEARNAAAASRGGARSRRSRPGRAGRVRRRARCAAPARGDRCGQAGGVRIRKRATPPPERRHGPSRCCGQAAQRCTGMPRLRALSTRLSVMPEPGKAMTPFGRRLSSSSLRRNGAARPCLSQSGLQTTWWTPLRSAQLAAIFSTPGPPPWTRTRSAYLARTLSRRLMTAAGFAMSFPPAMATRVPCGRWACVLRSLRARTKSRASMAAEVRCPVWLAWLPRRGRQVSPVSAR